VVPPKIVSLFSGAGGLDLGFSEAGYELALAIDNSKWAIETHKVNFSATRSVAADLVALQPAGVLSKLGDLLTPGEAIGVIGGPPCQGFSRGNPKALAADPRNKLPLLYLEIVEALQAIYDVKFVLFENVLGIRDVKHAEAFSGILDKFKQIGLTSSVSEFCALDFGVPQNRKRIIISGFTDASASAKFVPKRVSGVDLTVRGAIGHLPEPAFYSRHLVPDEVPHHVNHWTMRPLSKRFSEPENVATGARSFRRLAWDKPSPTVAYGHREIHVHPSGHRRLSIHEAMLLQGFPSSFTLKGPLSSQVEQVSNAVPPPLARALADAALSAMATNDSMHSGVPVGK